MECGAWCVMRCGGGVVCCAALWRGVAWRGMAWWSGVGWVCGAGAWLPKVSLRILVEGVVISLDFSTLVEVTRVNRQDENFKVPSAVHVFFFFGENHDNFRTQIQRWEEVYGCSRNFERLVLNIAHFTHRLY